ncbi:MAG: energy transducer TonB [Pseudomonadota bacterium]
MAETLQSTSSSTTAEPAGPGITHRDRFQFSLFLALALHGLIILGIGFSSELNQPNTQSIEVTVSLANDLVEPDEADFIAAQNQLGSGTADRVVEMTSAERSDFQSNTPTPVFSPQDQREAQPLQTEPLVNTQSSSTTKTPVEDLEREEAVQSELDPSLNREQLIQEIASLEARIAQNQQALANRPRTKHLSQVTTRSAAEAAYLNMWREKCERIGRINYPAGDLEGEVLMLVSISADGVLQQVKILRSSGHRALDQAALATVRQAAPFQPFGVEMRKQYDVLEFTRTWQFTKAGSSLVSGG